MLHACAAKFNVTRNLKKFLFLGELNKANRALFSWQFFWILDTIVLSFVFGNYYLIINWLGSKDSSHKFKHPHTYVIVIFCVPLQRTGIYLVET